MRKRIERISELTQEDARKIILTKLENELDHDKAVLIRDYEYNLDREKTGLPRELFLLQLERLLLIML